MYLTIPSHALKDFTRCVLCLSKFGEDIDLTIDKATIKLSTVNSSRSAFCLFTFKKDFFSNFGFDEITSLQINAKALLAPLRTKSVGSIEYVTFMLSDGEEEGNGGGECRLIIRLYCQHGVVKTRKLTYTEATSLFARANKNQCPSNWTASSKILKDWMEHFHAKTGGANTAGTDEIGFAFKARTCTITSSTSGSTGISATGADFYLNSRPTSTEITVDTDDFDLYEVAGEPSIMFALKEFKAIILIADSLNTTLSAAFAKGGMPILIELSSDFFKADFVIATSPFYDSIEGFKEEPIEPPHSQNQRQPSLPRIPSTSQKIHRNGLPLFKSSPEKELEEEDDFGEIEFNEDDFAILDAASQAVIDSKENIKSQILAPDSSLLGRKEGEGERMELEEEENFYGGGFATHEVGEGDSSSPEKVFGPTQFSDGPNKRSKPNAEWQLFPC